MTEIIGEPATLEMIAEECTELAQASLKLARALRKENPTPRSVDFCQDAFMEEWADLLLCSEYMDEFKWFNPKIVNHYIRAKKQRTNERILKQCQRNTE